MRVSQAIAEILKREGVKQPLRLSAQPLDRGLRRSGHPPDHRAPGAHRRAHGGRVSRLTSGDTVGVFCMQAGPGVENSFGAVAQAYFGGRAAGRDPRRLGAGPDWVKPGIQRRPQLPARHEVGRAGDDARRHRRSDAARLHPGAQRPPWPRAARDPRRHVERGGAGELDYTPYHPRPFDA